MVKKQPKTQLMFKKEKEKSLGFSTSRLLPETLQTKMISASLGKWPNTLKINSICSLRSRTPEVSQLLQRKMKSRYPSCQTSSFLTNTVNRWAQRPFKEACHSRSQVPPLKKLWDVCQVQSVLGRRVSLQPTWLLTSCSQPRFSISGKWSTHNRS